MSSPATSGILAHTKTINWEETYKNHHSKFIFIKLSQLFWNNSNLQHVLTFYFSNILMKNKSRFHKCKICLECSQFEVLMPAVWHPSLFSSFSAEHLTPESTHLVSTVLVLDSQGGQDRQTELEGGKQQLSVAGHRTGQEILITLLLRYPTDRQINTETDIEIDNRQIK